VIPANVLASEFSAKRAMTELPAIAKEPHPMGSPANAAVQSYLIQQITALRLTPVVQTTTVTSRQPGSNEFLTGTVHNVIVRLKGTASTRAILLDAHYNSAATAPGATDDGSAVVTALETLRALGASPPLKTMWFDEDRTKETDFATQKNILTSHMNGPTCTLLLGVTTCSSTMTHLFPF
jgi:Peptidase family M28